MFVSNDPVNKFRFAKDEPVGVEPPLPPNEITAAFFSKHAAELARDLLGKRLIGPNGVSGIISDVQAYTGENDPDSHRYRGASSAQVNWRPGALYIYSVQGHAMLTFAAPNYDQGACVLVRGLRMEGAVIEGPGRITKALGVTTEHNGTDVFQGPIQMEAGIPVRQQEIIASERVNSKDTTLNLRFRLT